MSWNLNMETVTANQPVRMASPEQVTNRSSRAEWICRRSCLFDSDVHGVGSDVSPSMPNADLASSRSVVEANGDIVYHQVELRQSLQVKKAVRENPRQTKHCRQWRRQEQRLFMAASFFVQNFIALKCTQIGWLLALTGCGIKG